MTCLTAKAKKEDKDCLAVQEEGIEEFSREEKKTKKHQYAAKKKKA